MGELLGAPMKTMFAFLGAALATLIMLATHHLLRGFGRRGFIRFKVLPGKRVIYGLESEGAWDRISR